jgi:hypothetical protein
VDSCPSHPNPDQADRDNDGIGDICDLCPDKSSPNQKDRDGDKIGNICDNCPRLANLDQSDQDGDDAGDSCDCYACNISDWIDVSSDYYPSPAIEGSPINPCNDGNFRRSGRFITEYFFDKWGNLVWLSNYGYGSYDDASEEFSYDEQGNLTAHSFASGDINDGNSYFSQENYAYDQRGNLQESSSFYQPSKYEEDRQFSRSTYEYDAKDRLIRIFCYDDDLSTPQLCVEYGYDEQNRCNLVTFYHADGTISQQRATEYNENGDITREVTYDQAGNILTGVRYEYLYWPNGQGVRRIQADLAGNIASGWEDRYNDRKQQIWQAYLGNGGKTISKEEYFYDATGRVWKVIYRQANGAVSTSWEYEFDSQGRNLSKTQYDSTHALKSKVEWVYDHEHLIYVNSSDYRMAPPLRKELAYEYNRNGELIKIIAYGNPRLEWRQLADPDGNFIKIVQSGDLREEWTCRNVGEAISGDYNAYNSTGDIFRSGSYWHEYYRAPGCASSVSANF